MAPNTRTPHTDLEADEVAATRIADPSVADVRPTLVEVPAAPYLSIEGGDAPLGAGIDDAIRALQLLGAELAASAGGARPIEVLRWLPHVNLWDVIDTSIWRWRVMIARDDGEQAVASAVGALRRHRSLPVLDALGLTTLEEGRCVQALHRGGTATMRRTLARIQIFALERGLAPAGPRHDISLTDPLRSTSPAMRTILRRPVLPAG